MSWQNSLTGTIPRNDLLNALLAIWKVRQGIGKKNDLDEFSQGYETGFEEGLDAVAQVAGIIEEFEAGKDICRAKIKMKLASMSNLIDGHATLLD